MEKEFNEAIMRWIAHGYILGYQRGYQLGQLEKHDYSVELIPAVMVDDIDEILILKGF